jgi:ATP-dependent helicase/nuclease subunit A
MAPEERIRPRLIRPSDAVAQPARKSPVAGDTAARFSRGILVHALLARLPDLPPAERMEAARRYLAARAPDAETGRAILAETFAILDHSQFAAAFATGSRAEAAIVADLPELGGGTRVSGRLDRLAVSADAVLAVDFKTNRPAPARAEDVAPLYLGQMALYRAALGKLFPNRRIDCALVWTEGPKLMPLPAALLDAELARIDARLDRGNPGS